MPVRTIDEHRPQPVALVGGRVLDTEREQLGSPVTIVVRDGRIAEIRPGADLPAGVREIEIGGRVVMPGLVDAHAHPTQTAAHAQLLDWDASYLATRTSVELERMLRRGFTTVRDMGGAENGFGRAVRERLITAPRLLTGGPIFAPTGGHALTRTIDGEVEIRRALREQFRDGADHIKLTVSGGVISKMRIEALGFSREELLVAVEEARLAKRYIAAHAYTAEAVNRALECGIRTIEHGTHIDDESLRLLTELEDVHLVPTLATYWASLEGSALEPGQRIAVADLFERGLDALQRADAAGVSIGYGTDLHGAGLAHQLEEVRLRARVQTPEAILRSLTVSGAAIVGLGEEIGRVREGYAADLLVLDADPRADLDVLADAGRRRLVITDGQPLD
ncbi:amidohydrolase family protein [Leucobacter sp. GX24907]